MSHDESLKSTATWRQVLAIVDGREVPVGRAVFLTVHGTGYTITVNGRVYQRGTSTNVPDKNPPHADVVVSEGPNAGQTAQQIFHIHGDVLVSCIAGPGAPRPTEFTSTPGSGHILSVWLRTTPDVVPQPLTARTWLGLVALVLIGALAGAVSNELTERFGTAAGLVPGVLAGACVFTALFRWLLKSWPYAITAGITVAIAGTVFEATKTAVANSMSAPAAIFVSAATTWVVGYIVWKILARLFKIAT